jgi:hypothetical protein
MTDNLPAVRSAAHELTLQTWETIKAVGPTMHGARLFGVSNPEQAMAIMVKGHELGLGLAASFDFIQVVMGKPTLSPRGALALIQASPLCEKLSIVDTKGPDGKPAACTVTMKRRGGLEYSVTWTMDDARAAGVVKADSGWTTYPANMLRWRAIGFCADVVFPDVIGGMKRADELGADLTPGGDVIDGSWTAYQAPQSVPAPTPTVATQSDASPLLQVAPGVAPEPAITLNSLIAQYSAEAILVANEGKIPATDEDLARVAAKLGAQ